MGKKVGARKVRELLADAVERRGADYVYPVEETYEYVLGERSASDLDHVNDLTCMYFYDGGPSCIVGEVLYSLGVSEGDLTVNGPFPAIELNTHQNRIVFSETALGVLSRTQKVQDRGYTWGEALEEAQR